MFSPARAHCFYLGCQCLEKKHIAFHEEVQLYSDTDVPIYFTMLCLLNRHMGAQIVCQERVWTQKICVGS